MARRETLSAFHWVYRFVQRQYHARPSLEECARGDARFLGFDQWSSIDAPWSLGLHCVDASEAGFAVHFCETDAATAGDVGRVSERGRFRLGACRARAHAAEVAGLGIGDGDVVVREKQARYRDADGPPDVPESEALRWEVNGGFPEVPIALLAQSRLSLVRLGAWRIEDGILLLEARGL